VYTWGSNLQGQLGINSVGGQPAPIPMPGMFNMVSVSAGGDFSLILNNLGRVYSVGSNSKGQLGIGSFTNMAVPQLITGLVGLRIVAISAGYTVAAVLTDTGDIWTMGSNEWGELGIGYIGGNSTVPVKVITTLKFDTIQCGYDHILARSGGNLYGFGANDVGQVGLTERVQNATTPMYIAIPGGGNLASFSTRGFASFALLSSGLLYVWGSNNYGQLGLGTKKNVYSPSFQDQ
jgi:alpha-tubulin suppressor-like RCC1 family protein